MGNRCFIPEVKRPERESDYSLLSSVELKKVGSYISTSTYIFMAWSLIKFFVVW